MHKLYAPRTLAHHTRAALHTSDQALRTARVREMQRIGDTALADRFMHAPLRSHFQVRIIGSTVYIAPRGSAQKIRADRYTYRASLLDLRADLVALGCDIYPGIYICDDIPHLKVSNYTRPA